MKKNPSVPTLITWFELSKFGWSVGLWSRLSLTQCLPFSGHPIWTVVNTNTIYIMFPVCMPLLIKVLIPPPFRKKNLLLDGEILAFLFPVFRSLIRYSASAGAIWKLEAQDHCAERRRRRRRSRRSSRRRRTNHPGIAQCQRYPMPCWG